MQPRPTPARPFQLQPPAWQHPRPRPRARSVSAHHTHTFRAPSTDPRTPRHRPRPPPGARPKGVAEGKAKPWMPLARCSPFTSHAPRRRPARSPPTAAKSRRKAVTRQQNTQAAKTLTVTAQPAAPSTHPRTASPRTQWPSRAPVDSLCSQPLFFLLHCVRLCLFALSPARPSRLPRRKRQAHALGSPRRVAAGRTKP